MEVAAPTLFSSLSLDLIVLPASHFSLSVTHSLSLPLLLYFFSSSTFSPFLLSLIFFFFCLNIAFVPANMVRLSFGPCKIKNQKSIPAKKSVF
ncbi:hypothetical protein MtrunA17_Chr1g0163951 [Medicago truncatula]|uniref:Transmembrane protein n=1 Tax=Medicago truncatula TaxID=3880 RepID=A0A396JUE6_MEDTR|nr:hypothetical protein MtrunA17_Chr1g0163951 [Medicago truncatula]